ncbi:MAG: flagellar hook protein [Denitrovibrio sp.]|nr:MAG: flagellar hook protein [Denitrovibrio sp.]
MAGIQVGGIVSGLDTNSIVDQLMQQARVPVDRLYGDYEYKNLENTVFSDINNMLGNINSDLLNLRLESTFKTKLTSSTNDSVVTATATTDAEVRSHSISVSQLAQNSIASSAYTRFSLSHTGMNITKVTGLSYDYLEAVHNVTVEQSGADYVSTTKSTVQNVGTMSKAAGAAIDGANVDSYGEMLSAFTGDVTISYDDENGDAQTLTVSGTFASIGEDINDLASNLEFALNQMMNSSMGTNAVQYISMRAEHDSGTWNLAMYETTVDDYNISMAGTDAGTLRNELGFAEAYTPTTSSTTTMYKYHVADSLANLQAKMFSPTSGVVSGATFTVTDDITTGSITIAQDSSLKVSSDTYSTYTGAAASTGSGIDTTVKGLDAAGFSTTIDSNMNGTFTINDTVITIDDYTKISTNDLLGIINSSGAGVTASYDSGTDKFSIKSNNAGSSIIDLGAYGDTSDIIKLLKLDYSSDRTFKAGSTEGNIDATSKLTDSGLTAYPYTGTFSINGVSIYVDTSTESLNDVIAKVNRSGAGVTMSYDSNSDKISMVSDGIDEITVGSTGDTSNLLEALNLTSDTETAQTIGETGQRAILTVDGSTYVRESNTVSDIISGVTLTLNGTSTSAASIGITVDSDKAVEAFSKFAAHYNELMEKLNVPDVNDDEEKYMEYLSDADRENMGEDEIANYIEKYEMYNTYDIIRKSSELRNMDTALRKAFFSERSGINDSINDMSDIGIEVAGAGDLNTEFYGYIAEFSTDYEEIMSKLKENSDFISALTEKPDSVFKFFANSPDKVEKTDPGYSEYQSKLGWSRYFSNLIQERYTSDTGMIGNKLGAGGTIYSEIASLQSRIESQENRVESQLEMYWAQFTAMENAIADAQSQASDFNNASGG